MRAVLNDSLLSLRPMVTKDLHHILRIECMVQPFPWSRAIFRDCLQGDYDCQVLELDGIIAGYAVMSVCKEDAHLLNLCIDSGRHRMGLGSFLLKCMLGIARNRKAESTFLEVRASNEFARQFYRKLGFVEAGLRRDYYPALHGREDAVIMALEIL